MTNPTLKVMCDCKSPIVSNVGKNCSQQGTASIGIHPIINDVFGENHIEITL